MSREQTAPVVLDSIVKERPPAEQAKIAELERQFPGWQVWTIRTVTDGVIWCARRHDNQKVVFNSYSDGELAAELDSWEAEAAEERQAVAHPGE